jgi:hypothetical protein
MTKRSRQALYILACVYLVALVAAAALWSIRNNVAQFLTLEWFRDVLVHLWSVASGDLLSAFIVSEVVALVILGYVWWLGDVKQRTWPKLVRKFAPVRGLMAALAFAVYVIISPVAFLLAYIGFRDNMNLRGVDRREGHGPTYTGPERRAARRRQTQQRQVFAGHPGYHSIS